MSVLISVSEPTASRLLLKSQELQVSLPTLLEQVSNSLDRLVQAPLSVPQQAVAQPPVQAKRRAGVKHSPQFAEAIKRAEALPSGEHFTLAKLFVNEWKTLPSPRVFGRLFRVAIERRGIAKHVGDDRDVGMAKYVRL